MPSKKNAQGRKQRNSRTTREQGSRTPGTTGDIPPRQRVDYSTVSTVLPRPTGQITMRQLAPLQTITASATGVTNTVVTFALNGINGAATLTSLFDLYKIDAIRVTVRPNNNALGLADPTVTSLLPLYWVIDYNDAVVLASANAALEYDNCMILSPGESASRTFTPKYSLLTKSAAGSDYISRSGDWLNAVSDDVLHYGCKFFVPQAGAAQTFLQTWIVEQEYYLTLRAVS